MAIDRLTLAITVLLCAALAAGCATMRSDGPLQSVSYPPGVSSTSDLIVFLRGIGGSHKTFARDGWIEAVRERGLPHAMVTPNAHFGYYRDRTLVPRLSAEVIAPAQAAGRDRICLVGVSMGGLGSLLYLRERPNDLSTVVLIAPYLGRQELTAEIQAAGGVRSWDPGEIEPDDWDRALWAWIKETTENFVGKPTMILGFGRGDDHVASQNLLAEVLPAEHVITVDGPHRNATFAALWREMLGRGLLDP